MGNPEAGDSRKRVITFRERLLGYSETFIAHQGSSLPEMQAIYAGFAKDHSGLYLLPEDSYVLRSSQALYPGFTRIKLKLDSLLLQRRWLRRLDALNASLLHAHFGPDGIQALPIARALQLPLVVTFHGYDICWNQFAASYEDELAQLFREADRIIAISKFVQEKLIARGCPTDKVEQHYIGIPIEETSAKKIEDALPTVLFVGRLVEKKGCRYFLEAVERAGAHIPKLRAVIIGGGPLEQELRTYAASMQQEVSFLGIQPREVVKAWMSRAWVMCTPSILASTGDTEGLGMVFLESQVLGTPVASFNTGGIGEAVLHRETGLLAEDKNLDQLTDHLIELLENKVLRETLGSNGIEHVRANFDIRKQGRKLEEIYSDVIAKTSSN